MSQSVILWTAFGVLAGIILFAGANLSKYGDIIAEKTGMGRSWIGLVLVASVTSLPELITGISSVAIFDLPDIAVGNVLGACMFNLFTLALLDVLSGSTPLTAKAHQGQVITAGFGIVLLGLVGISISGGASWPSVGWIGAYSLLIFLVYAVAIRTVFLFEKKRIAEYVHDRVEAGRYEKIPLKKALWNYAWNAFLVAAAAVYLPYLGDQIAEATGLGRTFVGSIFIALTTTLPELVVSVAALRIDAADLAFGNLLGSNLFNLAILALDDVFYVKGPLLANVTPTHLVTANAAMSMTAIAVIGLTYRAARKRFLFAWDTLSILAVYLLAVTVVYLNG